MNFDNKIIYKMSIFKVKTVSLNFVSTVLDKNHTDFSWFSLQPERLNFYIPLHRERLTEANSLHFAFDHTNTQWFSASKA